MSTQLSSFRGGGGRDRRRAASIQRSTRVSRVRSSSKTTGQSDFWNLIGEERVAIKDNIRKLFDDAKRKQLQEQFIDPETLLMTLHKTIRDSNLSADIKLQLKYLDIIGSDKKTYEGRIIDSLWQGLRDTKHMDRIPVDFPLVMMANTVQ